MRVFLPIRSPILLPIRMNAGGDERLGARSPTERRFAVVSRSRTTAEIETFISEVSTDEHEPSPSRGGSRAAYRRSIPLQPPCLASTQPSISSLT